MTATHSIAPTLPAAIRCPTGQTHREAEDITKQLRVALNQIETVLERTVEADNASIIRAYDGKIAKLEREGLLLAEKATRIVPPKGRVEGFIEPALVFFW